MLFASINAEGVPVVHALLPDKTQETYELLLRTIRARLVQKFRNCQAMENGTFNIDFEAAMKAAVGNVFPNMAVKGCLFHYSQAIQRNVQLKGWKQFMSSAMSLQLHSMLQSRSSFIVWWPWCFFLLIWSMLLIRIFSLRQSQVTLLWTGIQGLLHSISLERG